MPPTISVIVPVHNGAAHLEKSLPALKAALDAYVADGGKCEIIVVNDASSDRSSEIAAGFSAKTVKLDPPANGPSVARNRGAAQASGEILVFIDADVVCKNDTILQIGKYFDEHTDIHAIFGSYDDKPADMAFVSQYKNLFHHYVHQNSEENSSSFWAGCGAIRAVVFRELGGFPENYKRPAIEDIELGYTMLSRGYKSRLIKTLQVKHLKKWTFFNLVKTDILLRGVPWTRLLLRTRSFTSDLNLQTHNRISVVLVYLMILLCFGALKWKFLYASILPLAVFFVILNFGLYQFFAEKKSFKFAIAAIPMHFIYYFYNGVGFMIGLAWHYWETKLAPPFNAPKEKKD